MNLAIQPWEDPCGRQNLLDWGAYPKAAIVVRRHLLQKSRQKTFLSSLHRLFSLSFRIYLYIVGGHSLYHHRFNFVVSTRKLRCVVASSECDTVRWCIRWYSVNRSKRIFAHSFEKAGSDECAAVRMIRLFQSLNNFHPRKGRPKNLLSKAQNPNTKHLLKNWHAACQKKGSIREPNMNYFWLNRSLFCRKFRLEEVAQAECMISQAECVGFQAIFNRNENTTDLGVGKWLNLQFIVWLKPTRRLKSLNTQNDRRPAAWRISLLLLQWWQRNKIKLISTIADFHIINKALMTVITFLIPSTEYKVRTRTPCMVYKTWVMHSTVHTTIILQTSQFDQLWTPHTKLELETKQAIQCLLTITHQSNPIKSNQAYPHQAYISPSGITCHQNGWK